MAFISEADVEAALLDQLEALGYSRLADSIAGPDGSAPERASYSDVVLMDRLKRAMDRLNPDIPSEARQDALKKIIADETPSLIEENRRIHRALVEGIDVEFYVEDGTIRGDKVRLIDFDDPSANDWLAVDQFTVIEHGNNRRSGRGGVRQWPAAGGDRTQEPRNRERHAYQRLQPVANLQVTDPVPVSNKCGVGDFRRPDGADRLPDR